ncbi:Carbamoyl-phosphate synthase arginine-specific small chain [Chlamydiales bacterium SCGC AG-110-M15]|nr:Carbamoyl-phosphate synthase arginine-specific small chain [Chlamydiales bacterium SCGC AG-110-M15]
MKSARLVLKDGSVYEGYMPRNYDEACHGEVVFTTGMTGYCESLTDPSYAGQILVFTYPLIGNYGIPDSSSWESHMIHASGVIVNIPSEHWSHSQAYRSLLDWLHSQKVPLLCHVDTRRLTKTLRSHGDMLGSIGLKDDSTESLTNLSLISHVPHVSTKEIKQFGKGEKHVILVDCGLKQNILRELLKLPIRISQVPYNYDYSDDAFDGVFLSNGPGDPAKCIETIAILKKAMERKKPIYGICLGTQIMALAAGATTYKLPFGHRGHNQPCMDLESGRCYITSQNHGYAIDESTLPSDWRVSFRNLNDDSIEGVAHRELPFASVQFHPEAAPGPTDTLWFFKQFYKSLCDEFTTV